jgi:glycosyltransferase involved in cell wall biosynthesis
MKTVSIIQRQIPHYRSAFFSELYRQAKGSGFDVTVYSGSPPEGDLAKDYQYKVLPLKALRQGKKGPCWIAGLGSAIHGSYIVIAPQELQCLNVPVLWANRKRLCRYWIWWGHGYNFQARSRQSWLSPLQESVKNFMTRRGDGLITYTLSGAEYWRGRGMQGDRVVAYLNTLDVEGLREAGARVTDEQLDRVKQQLALEEKRILLFSGRLYEAKKIDFLLEAFALLQQDRRDVALLILGDGPDKAKLEGLANELKLRHVHFLGEENNPERASVYFKLADMLVIPGLVGLAIVHGFAYGLPIVTTEHDFHSPEIEYLSPNTGLITDHDPRRYALAILRIIDDVKQLGSMRMAAEKQADVLSLKASGKRFAKAIADICRPFPQGQANDYTAQVS